MSAKRAGPPIRKLKGGRERYSKEACARRLVMLRRAISHIKGRKITQTEFSQKAGLTQSGYTHYENAARIPSLEAAAALVDTYDISLDWLYLGNDFNMPFDIKDAIAAIRESDSEPD